MNWLITGGCGFIGTNLVARLVKEGDHYVRIIDNLKSGSTEKLARVCSFGMPPRCHVEHGHVHLFIDDIVDADFAKEICQDVDVIVHLAANTGVPVSVEFPVEDCLNNVFGTLNYLEGARHAGVKKFIFASSSAVPGDHEPPYHEKLFTKPISPYGASKCSGEKYCYVYNETYGVDTVALRFSNVYGPMSENKYAQLISKFIQAAVSGETLEIYGDGSQTRDFCYVDDLIDAIQLAVDMPVGGNIFQVATNVETSVQKITDLIIKGLSKYDIKNIKVKYGNERPGDVKRNFSDTSKARNLLGWQNKVSIEEGIERTIKWYMEEL